MVWVGTSLPTRGVVFQWARTIKTGRGSDWHKTGPVHTLEHLHDLVVRASIELGRTLLQSRQD